jgi:hypothetical protein
VVIIVERVQWQPFGGGESVKELGLEECLSGKICQSAHAGDAPFVHGEIKLMENVKCGFHGIGCSAAS